LRLTGAQRPNVHPILFGMENTPISSCDPHPLSASPAMQPATGASTIGEDARELFDAMRELSHGRMEHVDVTGGVPRLGAKTKLLQLVRRDRKSSSSAPTGGGNAPHRQPHGQHPKLLAACRAIGEGVISRIEVADGLPVHWVTPERSATAIA
jgi:hypothetical protein